MEKNNFDFHLAEYSALRSEMALQIRFLRESLFFTAIANSAVMAWLLSNGMLTKNYRLLFVLSSWLPLIITLTGLFLYRFSSRNVQRMATYCQELERLLAFEGLGWETWLQENRRNKGFIGGFSEARKLNMLLFILQFFIAIVVGFHLTYGSYS